jgi:tRNA A-37 threonylcarbamoyl transferase component Bud32
VKEQLVKSWHLHDEKNTLLLQSISEEALAFSLNTKGRNIGQQFAHMHNNRINWLEFVAKNLHNKADLLSKDAIATIFLLENSFSCLQKNRRSNYYKLGKRRQTPFV